MTRFRTRMFDGRWPCSASGLCLAVLLCGCAGRGNSELLEAQLRRQESVIRKVQQENSQLRSELALSQQEMNLLRADQAAKGEFAFNEETSRNLVKATGLVFNSLLSAGLNYDEQAGDERFHAVCYPHDAQGEIVKLTGRLEIEALDPSRPADQRSLGRWEYTPEQTRALWRAGFLSSGFQIEEAWKVSPAGNKVVLLARLVTVDGRTFEATHTLPVEVSLASAAPGLLPAASETKTIEPVKFETAAQSRTVPDPEPWEFETGNSPKKLSRPQGTLPNQSPTSAAPAKSAEVVPAAEAAPAADSARPFPGALQTSDRWTDETQPVVR